MKISVQIIIDHENGKPAIVKPVTEFSRENLAMSTLGLTLNEAKLMLKTMQTEITQSQINQYIDEHKKCNICQKCQPIKGHNQIVYKTLFGKLTLDSPRLYTCKCQKNAKQSFSPLSTILTERMSPELQFLESKWASLVSYGLTSDILQDVLPIKANISTIFNVTQKTAERLDAEIEQEKYCYINEHDNRLQTLPSPDDPLTVGLDGGYIHARDGDNRKAGWFEAIVGKSLQDDKPSKRFGFVCTYDDR